MFQPAILHPVPDPFFVEELSKIDPALRVVWGYERYLCHRWAIERRLSPERYFAMYRSLLVDDQPRFIDQPIYDTDQKLFDAEGNEAGYRVVGYRKFDLAPEYEWVMFVQNRDGSRRQLDGRTLLELRRLYAERFHSFERLAQERQRIRDREDEAAKTRRCEDYMDAVEEGWRKTGVTALGGQPETVFTGEE